MGRAGRGQATLEKSDGVDSDFGEARGGICRECATVGRPRTPPSCERQVWMKTAVFERDVQALQPFDDKPLDRQELIQPFIDPNPKYARRAVTGKHTQAPERDVERGRRKGQAHRLGDQRVTWLGDLAEKRQRQMNLRGANPLERLPILMPQQLTDTSLLGRHRVARRVVKLDGDEEPHSNPSLVRSESHRRASISRRRFRAPWLA